MTAFTTVSTEPCFGGSVQVLTHKSSALGGLEARVSLFLPPAALGDAAVPVPVLLFLSGLTCNETNFITKAGAQRAAAAAGIALVCPDTSPRGAGCPGEDESWDFGTGAGFYVDATEAPWSTHYRMYSYVTADLPAALRGSGLPLDMDRISISGHSMGGHGALVAALSNPGMYRSVSAFAPICNPTACPWGEKAFRGYLGSVEAGRKYDASLIAAAYTGPRIEVLVHQGGADQFLADKQLLPETLVDAVAGKPVSLTYALAEDYTHSYHFVASFIDEHIEFHARHLCKSS
jgi:S-formylglutathione hydrolase